MKLYKKGHTGNHFIIYSGIVEKKRKGRICVRLFCCVCMAREFSKEFYHSKLWQTTREYILKRDNYLCVICGKPAEEVHHKEHLSPKNINDPAITINPNNLISLCRDCHFEQHRGEHGTGRQSKEEYEYKFDENGYLIKSE